MKQTGNDRDPETEVAGEPEPIGLIVGSGQVYFFGFSAGFGKPSR